MPRFDLPPAQYGAVAATAASYGVGRTALYALAARHPQIFLKLGRRTLVDRAELDRVLSSMPRGASPARGGAA
jgi:hypothetical protein